MNDTVVAEGSEDRRMPLKRAMLAQHWLFACLADSELTHLARCARFQFYLANSPIFFKGELRESMLTVVSGRVKICSQSPHGEEIVFNVIHPGESLGEISLLDVRPRTTDAVTMQDSEILILERRDFMLFVRQKPDLAYSLLKSLCGRIRDASEQTENFLFRGLHSNLALVILRLATATRNSDVPAIEVTQKQLSQIAGLSRETTNKQIREWVRRGWVETYRGGLTVHDVAALRQHAENV